MLTRLARSFNAALYQRSAGSTWLSGKSILQRGLASQCDFNTLVDHSLMEMLTQIEDIAEKASVDSEVDYAEGVLKIRVANVGTFVLNRQTPKSQLWFSSPISGPWHYDYAGKDGWVCGKSGDVLLKRLSEELGKSLQTPIKLELS